MKLNNKYLLGILDLELESETLKYFNISLYTFSRSLKKLELLGNQIFPIQKLTIRLPPTSFTVYKQ